MNSIGYELKKIARSLFLAKPTVSFCITCRDRLWQIQQTLPKNLKDNNAIQDRVEFVLVDFASPDGLQQWICDNFQEELKSGYLKYYYVEEGMPEWHMSVAKNTAHQLGKNEVLVNLDCDNFTGIKGGDYVARIFRKYGVDNTFLHMWTGDWGDGTHGRMAVSKKNFRELGGYDEGLEPFGGDDRDFARRAKAMGLKRVRRKEKKYLGAVFNEKGEGFTEERQALHEMNKRNIDRSLTNIDNGCLVANQGREKIGLAAIRMFHE